MIDLSFNSIDDILTSSPTTIFDDAVREYWASRPKLIRECDNRAVQQASLWARFGRYVVGDEY